MTTYKVKIDGQVMPSTFTFDELIDNGILDDYDENILVQAVGDTSWTVARDYRYDLKENTEFKINPDGTITRTAKAKDANYTIGSDGTITREHAPQQEEETPTPPPPLESQPMPYPRNDTPPESDNNGCAWAIAIVIAIAVLSMIFG